MNRSRNKIHPECGKYVLGSIVAPVGAALVSPIYSLEALEAILLVTGI